MEMPNFLNSFFENKMEHKYWCQFHHFSRDGPINLDICFWYGSTNHSRRINSSYLSSIL